MRNCLKSLSRIFMGKGKKKCQEKMSRKINFIVSFRGPPYLCSIMQRTSFTFVVSCRGPPLTPVPWITARIAQQYAKPTKWQMSLNSKILQNINCISLIFIVRSLIQKKVKFSNHLCQLNLNFWAFYIYKTLHGRCAFSKFLKNVPNMSTTKKIFQTCPTI